MSNIDVVAMLLSNTYTDETVIGGGAIKGSPCTIKSKTPIEGGHRLTFEWTLADYTTRELTLDVMDGKDGKDGTEVEFEQIQTTGRVIGKLVIDGQEYNIYAPNSGGGGGGSSDLEDDLTVTQTVGGISAGTVFSAGTSLEQIFRDMLNPVAYPTLTNPSASLTATGAKLLETGATLNTVMTITFNRGSINPQYTAESAYRSGEATGYSLNSSEAKATNTFTITVTEAVKTYRGTVDYAQGVQPKDSVGHNYNSPLPAGSINTNTITYEFVSPFYANTANIETIAKLSLVSKSAKTTTFEFPSQTASNPEVFDVATSFNITAVEVLNTLSNQWEDCSSEFTVTNTSHDDASGTSVAYKRYTCNLGYATGSRKIKIKWA